MKVKKAKQKNNFLMTESARKKIIITLILILIIRVGSHLSIPGITQKAIIESRSFNLNLYSNSLPNLFSIGIGLQLELIISMLDKLFLSFLSFKNSNLLGSDSIE